MSACSIVSQLQTLLMNAKKFQPKLRNLKPTKAQLDTLRNLSLELSEAATNVQNKFQELEESQRKESERYMLKARLSRNELLSSGELQRQAIFRNNIIQVFAGPKRSQFDSADQVRRKEGTRKRCEMIRSLSPNGIISWAIAFEPTLWADGKMASHIFTRLLDEINSEFIQPWPQAIKETLHLLKKAELSLELPEYDSFLQS
jgi:hypothetical protein